MKNILMITFAFSIALLGVGCGGGLYGRGAMGAYGTAGYGSYGSGYGSMPYGAGGPVVGTPVGTGGLPVGARGALSPYGGSVYAGTGYTNPELTMAAAGRRADWARASASVPVVPMVASPCADGSCPTPVVEEAPEDTEARLDDIEEQVLADHGRIIALEAGDD